MKDITLLVMAAGMGSRYGGLKQLDPVGPNGETIIDYSVYDAVRSGFNKVVFIIRREFEKEFKSQITNKYEGSIKVEFAFQELNALPNNFNCPEGRIKPWGTGQAILTAAGLINEPFVAINGDDFYGRDSYGVIADYYKSEGDSFSMVAFQLGNTLSDFGGVSRGLCAVENGLLSTVVETHNIKRGSEGVTSDEDISLDGTEPVSMNVWGFTPDLFDHLRSMFHDFLERDGKEMKSEFLIPSVVNNLIYANTKHVKVLRTDSSWFGVTYKEDKPYVVKQIQALIDNEEYPNKLF
ncbi:MAG: NDP-sugar synthase [Candidatus Neomarinimicrobiota bacterium]